MPRSILDESNLHPAIREAVATSHQDIVLEVQAAMKTNRVVVVGMAQNPMVTRARRQLDAAGVAYVYLAYGNYFSEWRKRNALKMWTGWPTFPMVFADGMLLGGADDVKKLVESGYFKAFVASP